MHHPQSVIARALLVGCLLVLLTAQIRADTAALPAAIAAEVPHNSGMAQVYAARAHAPIWMGDTPRHRLRIAAFLDALSKAGDHALPVQDYQADTLALAVAQANDHGARATVELALSKAFMAYAQQVQSGILDPEKAHREIHRTAPVRDPAATLAAFATSSGAAFLAALPPQTAQYAHLMAELERLSQVMANGGWGADVTGPTLRIGDASPGVAALRARLGAMGYGRPNGLTAFDAVLRSNVLRFQRDHGLEADGIVGPDTMAALNVSAFDRAGQVAVALERERWMNFPLGARHVRVNIADFHARLVENNRVTFETRTVVGKNRSTHRTPEFSDVMEFMVINPTWHVPHSIATREYLPKMQQDPNAAGQLDLYDRNGRRVARAAVNFASYTARSFPYRLKQPPGDRNALGLVKFMFPNRFNVYLHDTPQKALFDRAGRAFSHGCVRLADPFGFAHALLAGEVDDPHATFAEKLATGRETTVRLATPVPVHLTYRTVIARSRAPAQFHRDVYGRDAAIFAALVKAGVSLRVGGG